MYFNFQYEVYDLSPEIETTTKKNILARIASLVFIYIFIVKPVVSLGNSKHIIMKIKKARHTSPHVLGHYGS